MLSVLNSPILILNKSWVPHDSTTVEDAFGVACADRGRFLDPVSYVAHDIGSWMKLSVEVGEDFIQTAHIRIKVPEIMLLTEYSKIPDRKVVFCRRNLWRRDRRRCFVPETLILMENGGLQRIDSIEVGDRILDFEGRVQDVEFVFSKHTKDDLVVLRHRGNGDYLTCTTDHKVLVSDKNFNMKWVEAGDITLSDYLCELSLHQEVMHLQNTRIPRDIDLYVNCHALKNLKCTDRTVRDYNRKIVHRHISIDEKLGRFVGYFLAEGNVFKNCLTFSLHIDEDDFASDIRELVKSIFGIDVSLKEFPDKHLQQIVCYSSVVAEFVRNWCFHNSEKRVQAKDLPGSYLRGILYGILRGDGAFNEEQFRATLMMKTENLVRDIYLISHLCGIRATLSKTGHREDGRLYKSVVYNAQEFNKITQVCALEKKQYSKNNKTDRLFDEENTKFISKVTSITRMPYNGLVYDLQISGSHTYIADFVCVHNCQYCGNEPAPEDITIDHIHPKSKGGESIFENCVLCCTTCNLKKGDRTLEAAGMRLQRLKKMSNGLWSTVFYEKPKRPMWNPLYALKRKTYPKSWGAFLKNFDESLYWEVELET